MGNSYERWDKWELPPSSVDRMTLVGEGTFGEVYQGMLQRTGRGKKDQSSVPVLVNSLRGTDRTQTQCACIFQEKFVSYIYFLSMFRRIIVQCIIYYCTVYYLYFFLYL